MRHETQARAEVTAATQEQRRHAPLRPSPHLLAAPRPPPVPTQSNKRRHAQSRYNKRRPPASPGSWQPHQQPPFPKTKHTRRPPPSLSPPPRSPPTCAPRDVERDAGAERRRPDPVHPLLGVLEVRPRVEAAQLRRQPRAPALPGWRRVWRGGGHAGGGGAASCCEGGGTPWQAGAKGVHTGQIANAKHLHGVVESDQHGHTSTRVCVCVCVCV